MAQWSDYKPSPSLLRYSLRKRSREFVRENSLHVVPYFIDPSRPIYQRFLWVIIFIASAFAATATILIIWQRFQTSPTLTYLYIERENLSVDFPNVYLCFDANQLDFDNSTLTLDRIHILRHLYSWNGKTLDYGKEDVDIVGYKRYFLDISPDCGSFYSDCEFGKTSFDCGKLFSHKIATPGGICCAFESKRLEKDSPSWSLQFQPSLYPISESEGAPIYGRQPTYKMIGPSSIQVSLTVTSTASSVRFLTRSQRKCVFPDESPSHVDCERKAMKKVFLSKCHCLPWFYAGDQLEECSLPRYDCLSEIGKIELTIRNCYISCDHTAYNCEKIKQLDIEISETDKENKTEVREGRSEIAFLTWPDVRFRRVTRFGWLDLVASFGGVAGFFLGYSIITSVEALYYFSLRTYCGAILSKPKYRLNVMPVPFAVKEMKKQQVNVIYPKF